MKCFVHPKKEAIAVCKKCGKAMCDNCSSYSKHSGICPECRCEEFIIEKENKIKAKERALIIASLYIILAIIISLVVIALKILILLPIAVILFSILVLLQFKERKALIERINILSKEIKRLKTIIKNTGEKAFE